MGSRVWGFAVAAVFLLAPAAAVAADLPEPSPPVPPAAYVSAAPDWIVTIGAEARVVPAWAGAPTSLYGFSGMPLFYIRKPGDLPFFFGARDSFGYPLLDFGPFQAGPVGRIEYPRYGSQYGQLNGLGDVPWALQLGGFAQYWALPWLRLRAELRQGIGGETGLTGDLFADAVVPLGQWRISGGPRMTVQSAAAISPYFGITAAQSAGSTVSGLPALPVYNASSGIYSYGAGGQVEYFWNPQWSTHAIVEYERLTGSAAASPLVTMRGSPNQFTYGVGATYTFNMHPLW